MMVSSPAGDGDPVFDLLKKGLTDLLGGPAALKKVEAALNAEIAGLTKQRDTLQGTTEALEAAQAKARQDAENTRLAAVSAAQVVMDDAHAKLKQAEAVVAGAQIEAARIIEAGKAEAKAFTDQIAAIRSKL